ncbi:MAG TPA: PASTA domain-containing protein, partial [Solirubrobacteraceae bacterium]|nr:PASTA domain-containing protein [Solirubrobacteraceae bacterium]
TQAASTGVASGLVVSQSPTLGSVVHSGTRVNIVVSSGPPSKPLVDVQGLTSSQAVAKLRAAGFEPSTMSQSSTSVAQGRVISTDPSAGTELALGSPVTVIVSSGPALVHVPDLTGQSQTAAESALTTAGLTVGSVTQQVSSKQAPGTVVAQSPSAGSSLNGGQSVDLVIAQAPKDVTVPSVVGQDEAAAAAALGAAGLNPKTASAGTTEPAQVGLVLRQSPSAGQQVRKGASVTITVGTLTQTTGPTGVSGATSPTTTSTPTTPAATPG